MTGEWEGVMGYFSSLEALSEATRRANQALYRDVEVYLPVEDEATIEETQWIGSLVRWPCIAGGIAGFVSGLWLTVWTSRDYPLVTGGKPVVALPPFLVISFELAILCAALGAIAGFLFLDKLPRLRLSSAYHQELAVDQFAILIRSTSAAVDRERAEALLRESGAVRIREVYREERGLLGESR